MKILLTGLLLVFICGCNTSNSSSTVELTADFTFPDMSSCVMRCYSYYATDRDSLIKGVKFPLHIVMQEQRIQYKEYTYSETYNTPEEIPYGNVYCGNGLWLIYYEQNKGYMPRMNRGEI